MTKIYFPLLIGLLCFLQLPAQTKNNQRPEDIKKIQSFQKELKPNGKNDIVVHPVKSDGTMDMRYKLNKEKLKVTAPGPKKADGTPDMRYKENKQVLKTSSAKPKRS